MSIFDTLYERKNTNCMKYDAMDSVFGRQDLLPFWIADMDFASPQPVIDALKKRMETPVFGYPIHPTEGVEAFKEWEKRYHGYQATQRSIVQIPSVVFGMWLAQEVFTHPGDNIIIQTPVYNPFFEVVKDNGRTPLYNSLVRDSQGRYSIHYEELEKHASNPYTTMLFFCSPHNPVGRVWEREELEKVAEICLRHDVLMVSDEVHHDFVYDGAKHIPILSLSEEVAKNSILLTAPNKTFNITGIPSGFAIIPGRKLRTRYQNYLNALHIGKGNLFVHPAAFTAYTEGHEWLREMKAYLKENRDLFCREMNALSEFSVTPPEATYLAWIDCQKLQLTAKGLNQFFQERAGLGLSPGVSFGKEGENFMRFNFAVPRASLREAIERIKQSVS